MPANMPRRFCCDEDLERIGYDGHGADRDLSDWQGRMHASFDHRVEAPFARNALERMRPTILKPKSGACDEIPHRGRGEYFPGSGHVADPGTEMDGDPLHSRLHELDLARVDSGSRFERQRMRGGTDCRGAADRACRPIERGEQAIAFDPKVARAPAIEFGPHGGPKIGQHLAPPSVPQFGGKRRRPDQIDEQNGRQHPVRIGRGTGASQKLFHFVGNGVRISDVRKVVGAGQLNEARAGNSLRDVPPLIDA